MNQKTAIKTLNYYGRERARAYRSNMDWMPARRSWLEMVDAYNTIVRSIHSASELLSRAGYSLFSEYIESRWPEV